VNAEAQRTVNLYPERIESGDGNSDVVLYPSPGLKKFIKFAGACLSIAKTHTGSFNQGQAGATYTITVTNNTASPGIGPVTVTETVPIGLTFVSMSGLGWTVTGNIATRSDALAPGASYPALIVTVNVALDAPASLNNVVSISGGGCSQVNQAQDATTIVIPPPPTNPISFNPARVSQSGTAIENIAHADTTLPLAIQLGDMLFLFVTYNFTANTSQIISMVDNGPLASWAPLTPLISYASSAGFPLGFQVFYGPATGPFAAGSLLTFTLTFSGPVQNFDLGTMSFLGVRGITALHRLAFGTVAPGGTQIAPSITTSSDSFVLSAIGAAADHFSIAPPYFVEVGFINYAAALSSGANFISPAGTYAASWINAAGVDSTAAAIMAAFV
jgi:uncharacterized repeat protein (TIGR01451 family)